MLLSVLKPHVTVLKVEAFLMHLQKTTLVAL